MSLKESRPGIHNHECAEGMAISYLRDTQGPEPPSCLCREASQQPSLQEHGLRMEQ